MKTMERIASVGRMWCHCYSCRGVEHRNAHEINSSLAEEEVENPCVCTAYCLKVFRL